VLLGMGLHCIVSVASGMNHVAARGVSMVCCLFVVTSLMMFGGFPVMTRGMHEVL